MSVNVLDVLYEAEARIADPNEVYDHSDWRYCLCGHVHEAATGRAMVSVYEGVRSPEFGTVIIALAEALDLHQGHSAWQSKRVAAALRVSDHVHPEVHCRPGRTLAREALKQAIRKIRADERRRRAELREQAIASEPELQVHHELVPA